MNFLLLEPQSLAHSLAVLGREPGNPRQLGTERRLSLGPGFLVLISCHFLYLHSGRRYSRFKSLHFLHLLSHSKFSKALLQNQSSTSKLLELVFDYPLLPPAAHKWEKTRRCLEGHSRTSRVCRAMHRLGGGRRRSADAGRAPSAPGSAPQW